MKKNVLLFLLVSLFSINSCFIKNIMKSSDELFDDTLIKIASDLKSKYKSPKDKVLKLAVLQFMNQNGDRSELGKIISNNLQSKLFDPSSFTLLERERIDSILEEHEFNQTGLVSDSSMKQLGKLLGTDLILVGTLNIEKSFLKITSRIVNVESGAILSIAEGKISLNAYINENYNKIQKKKVTTITGAYNFKVNTIKIAERKRTNQLWDAGDGNERPDIYYTLYLNEKRIYPTDLSSPHFKQDALEVSFQDDALKLILEKDDVIKIEVWDNDLLVDDIIGKIILPPNKILDLINNPNSILTFDQVLELKLNFTKIE